MPTKGRFAPSPSGRMHLGNLFSFLLAWLSVRHEGGSLVLRIEDLDPVRCQPSHAWQLMEDLEWLGLGWDEGGGTASYWQSNRGHLYAKAFAALEARGLTYPCFCSRIQRLNEAPHIHEVSPSCPCAALTAEEAAARAAEKAPSYRLRVPRRTVSFTDGLQGPYSQDLATQCGDFPIKRSDGAWAYQLAVVVDDAAMGVTQVVRGRDLLSSTPRQLWLYEALGLPAPEFYHVPLLLAPDGRRLAKRDADLDMGVLRRRYAPEELLGILARMAGQQETAAPVSAAQLARSFDWAKVPREDITVDAALLAKEEKGGGLMKDRFKFQVSQEKQNFDFSNPDTDQVSQVFNAMFGDSFPRSETVIPEGFIRCQPCEGTGRVIKIRKFLLGTSKTVTKTPCPHCQGKGYVPEV